MKKYIEQTEYERNYIELTEYDSNGRTVIFADSINGLCRTRLGGKELTEIIVSGYPLLVNESIDEILDKMEECIKEDNEPIDEIPEKMERCTKEDNKLLCEYDQGHLDGIEVGYEVAMKKINNARAEIIKEKLMNRNMEYDKIFELCILIIDKYTAESEGYK